MFANPNKLYTITPRFQLAYRELIHIWNEMNSIVSQGTEGQTDGMMNNIKC